MHDVVTALRETLAIAHVVVTAGEDGGFGWVGPTAGRHLKVGDAFMSIPAMYGEDLI